MHRIVQTARFILLLMSCSLCPAQGRVPEADPDASSLAIVMEFDDECSSLSLESMKDELESVFRQSRIRLQWRFRKDLTGREVFNRLAIVRFRGDCRTEQGPSFSACHTALGRSHVSDGSVLPFLDLNCPRIYEQVRPMIACQTLTRKEILFGRALARVLAMSCITTSRTQENTAIAA